MPARDASGPMGQGSRTGRGLGHCRPYIVRVNDTPQILADRYAFDLEELFRANPTLAVVTDRFGDRNIYQGHFKVGQRINLPVTAAGIVGLQTPTNRPTVLRQQGIRQQGLSRNDPLSARNVRQRLEFTPYQPTENPWLWMHPTWGGGNGGTQLAYWSDRIYKIVDYAGMIANPSNSRDACFKLVSNHWDFSPSTMSPPLPGSTMPQNSPSTMSMPQNLRSAVLSFLQDYANPESFVQEWSIPPGQEHMVVLAPVPPGLWFASAADKVAAQFASVFLADLFCMWLEKAGIVSGPASFRQFSSGSMVPARSVPATLLDPRNVTSTAPTTWSAKPEPDCYHFVEPEQYVVGGKVKYAYRSNTARGYGPSWDLGSMYGQALAAIARRIWKVDLSATEMTTRIKQRFATPHDLLSRVGWGLKPNESARTYAMRLSDLETCLRMLDVLY